MARHLLFQSHITAKTAHTSSQVSDHEQKQKDSPRSLTMSGHVGFESLPDQLVNRSIQQGFCFNILCVGETGTGKSTLIDTLFNTNFEGHESSHFYPHVRLKAQTYELQESNVRLKLTIVNTVGFGDQINKEERYMFSSSNKIVFFLLQDICLLALCADLTLICRNPCHSSQT